MLLGYSQFKTTSFKEIADEKNWAKVIIVEGYVYSAKTDFGPILVMDRVSRLTYDEIMNKDSYIMLNFDRVKFIPLEKGIFKARIKGIVTLRDCEYDIIGLDVIWYGLALSEKIERKRM
ncbi:MAG: hypothetical protein KAS91_00135 [Candidatus Pacebacteria bacterium]|nr:hypothetical protein [Candidatus Paceibacterota bacterium]